MSGFLEWREWLCCRGWLAWGLAQYQLAVEINILHTWYVRHTEWSMTSGFVRSVCGLRLGQWEWGRQGAGFCGAGRFIGTQSAKPSPCLFLRLLPASSGSGKARAGSRATDVPMGASGAASMMMTCDCLGRQHSLVAYEVLCVAVNSLGVFVFHNSARARHGLLIICRALGAKLMIHTDVLSCGGNTTLGTSCLHWRMSFWPEVGSLVARWSAIQAFPHRLTTTTPLCRPCPVHISGTSGTGPHCLQGVSACCREDGVCFASLLSVVPPVCLGGHACCGPSCVTKHNQIPGDAPLKLPVRYMARHKEGGECRVRVVIATSWSGAGKEQGRSMEAALRLGHVPTRPNRDPVNGSGLMIARHVPSFRLDPFFASCRLCLVPHSLTTQ
jgi:hypothetical protein